MCELEGLLSLVFKSENGLTNIDGRHFASERVRERFLPFVLDKYLINFSKIKGELENRETGLIRDLE